MQVGTALLCISWFQVGHCVMDDVLNSRMEKILKNIDKQKKIKNQKKKEKQLKYDNKKIQKVRKIIKNKSKNNPISVDGNSHH